MAQEINKVADALFEKIRSRFEDVRLGDDKAEATVKPEDARFFNFDYKSSDGESFGNITISVIDAGSLKIYFSKNISENLDPEQLKEWYQFLYEMRKFARRNLMSFDTRDISRSNLNLKDIQQVSKADSTYKSGDVAVTESRLYGTPKTSFENIGTARIRIIHTESINSEVRGSRARHINAIYVENAQGERFKLEHNKLGGARAMARHIAEGGNPYDQVGAHINEMVREMAELGTFVRGMRRRVFEDSMTKTMVEAAVAHYNQMHRQLNSMKGARTYNQFVESFEPQTTQLDEMDMNDLKERFVKKIFDDRMTAALPHVYKAYKLQEQSKQKQIEIVSNILEGQADLTLAVNEGMDEYMKMLRFQDTNSLVKTVLEDIASRAVTMPEVAQFASYWAKNYDTITEDDSQEQNRTIAIQLATHYIRDLRNIRENSNLRIESEYHVNEELDAGSDLIDEATGAIPKTPEELQALQQLLSQPIPFGMDGTNVTATLGEILADDELFDTLSALADDLGEEADAVPAIKEWLKDNWPGIYQQLGLGNEELDAPPAPPQIPPAPAPMPTAANQPAGQASGGVVSEDADLVQMLRIAGLLVK
jgi:hypothetical protein